jgi:cobalt-zinc-cadmium efflux system outer membrane protein
VYEQMTAPPPAALGTADDAVTNRQAVARHLAKRSAASQRPGTMRAGITWCAGLAAWALAIGVTPVAAAPLRLTLADVDARAAEANIDVIQARTALRSARAGVSSADTFPNPTVGLQAQHIVTGRIGNRPVGQISDTILSVNQTIETGGKRGKRIAAAQAALGAAHEDVSDAVRSARQSAEAAFFDLAAAEARCAVLADVAGLYGQSQTIAGRRLKAGDISGGDFARQQVEALRAAAALQQADSDRREAQLALAVLIGAEAQAADIETAGGLAPPHAVAAAEPADSVAERRPDVRAAQARAEAARRRLTLARTLRSPDVDVGALVEHDPDGVGTTPGLGVSIPLFIGNRYRGEIDAAGADVAGAEAAVDKARSVAIAEILTARAGETQAAARLRAIDGDTLAAARKAADTAEFAYAHGALSLTDLLDARRTRLAVELDAIDARAAYAKAAARRLAAETASDADPAPSANGARP